MNGADTAILGLFVSLILAMLSPGLQKTLKQWFRTRPPRIFLVPLALTALFCVSMASHHTLSGALAALVAAYTLAPTLLVYRNGTLGAKGCAYLDLAAILLLWLPLEFAAGASLVPRELRGTAHSIAYGVSVSLSLFLFLVFRGMPDMKYNLPGRAGDFGVPVLALLALIPILAVGGIWLSFLEPFHLPRMGAGQIGTRFAITWIGVALPEEILFRALIQNWLMRRFGFTMKMLAASALIFGLAHLNNAPGGFPNWRYAILATIAGFGFGRVFMSTSSIVSPALVHASVNTIKRAFF